MRYLFVCLQNKDSKFWRLFQFVAAKNFRRGSEGAAEGGCGGNSAAPERRSPAAPPRNFLGGTEQKNILFLLTCFINAQKVVYTFLQRTQDDLKLFLFHQSLFDIHAAFFLRESGQSMLSEQVCPQLALRPLSSDKLADVFRSAEY